ncbi:hypothetical protein AVEN_34630-1 [Araneus ventricosus]|uniref:Uncharacterized protein n=1 Tax=Araneus ventricosus TaxID=182803 RepID=A0A4Y2B1X0_ARAVE|nr:hypothetical protein AVEN_34630-1 [Araneus ventricosus]
MAEEAKRGQQVIGIMLVVSMQDSEKLYLRKLLLRKNGVISFNDLKTIDGIVCETFQEACKEPGILDDDQHWHDTLLEAARMHMPSYLIILFAMICGSLLEKLFGGFNDEKFI